MERDKILILQILFADIILMSATVVATFFIASQFNDLWLGGVNNLPNLIVMFDICLLACNAIYPSIIQNRIVKIETIIQRSLIVSLLILLLVSLTLSLFEAETHFPRTYILLTVGVFAIFSVFERIAISNVLKHARVNRHNTRQVLLVGKDKAVANLYNVLATPHYGYEIEAVFYDGKTEHNNLQSKHKGNTNELYAFLAGHPEIKEVYAHFTDNEMDKINMLSKYCDNHLIRFYFVPSANIFMSNMDMHILDGTPVVARREEPLSNIKNKLIKRLFDILFSSLVLVCIFPWIYVIVGIIIKFTSPGPVFFKQERTGLDGKVFKCIKFRTMKVNNESDTLQATEDDPRKYPFGDFMRRTNIDELPQFINVLKGDMSIVGPRPHMLRHTTEYSQLINRFMLRHLAKPGITGLAQVSGYRGETKHLEQMEGRIRYDIEYIENWTFLLDMKIIYKTIINMLTKDENAY